MASERRLAKVEGEIKRKFSGALYKLENPHLGFVTVTRVKLTSDLKQAKIYVSFLGNSEERETSFKALCGAKGFLRKELSKSVKLKTVPEFLFMKDESLDHVFKIETILKNISKNTFTEK